MRRPTRAELEAENAVLYDELLSIRERLEAFFEDEDDDADDTEEVETAEGRAS